MVFYLNRVLAGLAIALSGMSVFVPIGTAQAAVQIYAVGPPGVFTKPGSATNIHQVCTLGEALNLILDDAGVNTIRFHDPIVDMCKDSTITNLDEYVRLEKIGEVTVESDHLNYMRSQQGDITMQALPFSQEPDVLVDGQPATDKDISNKQWDGAAHTLKFTAKHFSTYKAVADPGSPKTTPAQTKPSDSPAVSPAPTSTDSLPWGGAPMLALAGLAVVLAFVYWLVRKRGVKQPRNAGNEIGSKLDEPEQETPPRQL